MSQQVHYQWYNNSVANSTLAPSDASDSVEPQMNQTRLLVGVVWVKDIFHCPAEMCGVFCAPIRTTQNLLKSEPPIPQI